MKACVVQRSGDFSSVYCVNMNELSPLCSVPVLIRELVCLPPSFHAFSRHRAQIVISPRLPNIQSFTLRHALTHKHTHTPYGRMSESCKTWCNVVGDCVEENDDDDGLCSQQQHRTPPLVYVCAWVCVGAMCQCASWLVILYVCPCVTQPCDRY